MKQRWNRFWFVVLNTTLGLLTGKTIEQDVQQSAAKSAKNTIALLVEAHQLVGQSLSIRALIEGLGTVIQETSAVSSSEKQMADDMKQQAKSDYEEQVAELRRIRDEKLAVADEHAQYATDANAVVERAKLLAKTFS